VTGSRRGNAGARHITNAEVHANSAQHHPRNDGWAEVLFQGGAEVALMPKPQKHLAFRECDANARQAQTTGLQGRVPFSCPNGF